MNSLTEARNRDFIRRCITNAQAELKRGHTASTRRIALLTIYGEAGGYFVSFKRALDIVYRYRALDPEDQRPLCSDKPSVLRAKHITEKVSYLIDQKHMSMNQALTRVLIGQHAPRFYFSVDYGMRLLNRYTKHGNIYQPVKAVV